MTQSALSKRVQSLEGEVGRLLFERRGPRGLKPLPAALELAKISGRVLDTWDAGLRKVRQAVDEPDRFLLVGPPLFLREVVLPWWIDAQARFPRVHLEVKLSSLEKVSLNTVQAGADAGILEHREELGDYVCKPMFKEAWGVVRHPESAKRDLRELTWGTYSARNNPVDTWLVARNRMPPVPYSFYWEDLTALVIWIAETPGAASVLPWHAVAWMVKRKRVLFELAGRDAVTQLYLAYPHSSPHKALMQDLMRYAEDFGHA